MGRSGGTGLVAVALLLLGVVFYAWWRSASGIGDLESGTPIETERAEKAPVAGGEATPLVRPVEVATFSTTEDAPRSGMTTLRVIRGKDGPPVPGAVVVVIAQPAPSPRRLYGGEHGILDLDHLVHDHGREVITDARGEVRIAIPAEGVLVLCDVGQHSAVEVIEPPLPAEVVLELAEARAATVQVVGPDGGPREGVPVAVMVGMGSPGSSLVVHRSKTGRDGVVRFRETRRLRELAAPPDGSGHLAIALAVPLAEPVTRSLPALRFPETVVRLVLPATGRVEVAVLKPEERPITVRLHRGDGGTASQQPEFVPLMTPEFLTTTTERGRAAFDFVGFETALTLEVVDPTAQLASFVERIPGPTKLEPIVVRTVSLEKPRRGLVAVLVDERGRPLAGHHVRVIGAPFELDEISNANALFKTDDEGRVRLTIRERDAEQEFAGELTVSAYDALPGRGGREELQGTVSVNGPVVPGDRDVGQVTLTPLPIIARGVVVDDAGSPLPGAMVYAQGQLDGQPHDASYVLADPEGRFTLRGPFRPGDPLTVIASEGSHERAEGLETRVGVEDLRVVLRRFGGLRGSVIVGDDVDPKKLRIAVGPLWTSPDGTGAFTLEGLLPGTVDVAFRTRWGDHGPPEEAAVLTLAGLEVVAGVTTEDPRLKRIDLRDLVGGFSLRLVDSARKPIEGTLLLDLGDGRGEVAHELDGGTLSLVGRANAMNASVRVEGYLPREDVFLNPGVNTIRLEDAFRIRFTLDQNVRIPAGDYQLSVRLNGRDGEGRVHLPTNPGPMAFHPSWSVTLDAEQAGTYEIEAFLVPSRSWRASEIKGTTPQVVELTQRGVTDVVLFMTPEAVERAASAAK